MILRSKKPQDLIVPLFKDAGDEVSLKYFYTYDKESHKNQYEVPSYFKEQ